MLKLSHLMAPALTISALACSSNSVTAQEQINNAIHVNRPSVSNENLAGNDEIVYPDDSQWWKRFGDELLDSLINLATERNYDVAMAAKRIEIARQGVTSARPVTIRLLM